MDQICQPAHSGYLNVSTGYAPGVLWGSTGSEVAGAAETEKPSLAEKRNGLFQGIRYAIAIQLGAGLLVWGMITLIRAL